MANLSPDKAAPQAVKVVKGSVLKERGGNSRVNIEVDGEEVVPVKKALTAIYMDSYYKEQEKTKLKEDLINGAIIKSGSLLDDFENGRINRQQFLDQLRAYLESIN